MVPMMIGQGYAAIAVAFDLWGLAGLVKDGMNNARELVEKMGEAETNGKETNGSSEQTVPVLNGKEESS